VSGSSSLNNKPASGCVCERGLTNKNTLERETKVEGSTHLIYTGFRGGLEPLKVETRLINERFTSVKMFIVNRESERYR
jgi:hypothetical protein